MHLLKVKHQPQLATVSWEASIEKQRIKIAGILEENPSLKPLLKDSKFIQNAYREAVLDAVVETGLTEATFPVECPFTVTDTKARRLRNAGSRESRSTV